MKTKLLLIFIAFFAYNSYAQTDNLPDREDITRLESQVEKQENQLNNLYGELNKEYRNYRIISKRFDSVYQDQKNSVEGLRKNIETNALNIKTTAGKIETIEKSTNESLTDLEKTVSLNKLYWIPILVVALCVLLVVILLRKQILKQNSDLNSQLQNTKKALEEEALKLDNKLAKVLETQRKTIDSDKSARK